jgi:hypothetical protein
MAYPELEEFGAIPTEEIAFDWEAEEITAVYPAWFLPEAEVAPRRPTRPVLMVIRDETTKEG